MKKEWWILLAALLLPLLGLFSYIGYISFSDKRTNKEVFLDFVKQDTVNGQIKSIYYQTKNHNQYTVATKNERIVLPQNWEHKFFVGDSISKDSGSLKLEHYRDGKLLEILDYNDIYIREGW